MNGNILVIDDNPSIGEVLEVVLTAEGFSVTILHNGNTIIEDIKKYQPQVIILDYLLAEQKGTDIARTIRQHNGTKHVPLIMISAHPKAHEEARRVGITVFLEKPFEMQQLLSHIHKYM